MVTTSWKGVIHIHAFEGGRDASQISTSGLIFLIGVSVGI